MYSITTLCVAVEEKSIYILWVLQIASGMQEVGHKYFEIVKFLTLLNPIAPECVRLPLVKDRK